MSEKPHKGRIRWWSRWHSITGKGLGYIVVGEFLDHPELHANADDKLGYTSYVVAHDEQTCEIETRNSRYTLVGIEQRCWPFEQRAHADDVAYDKTYPECLRTFILYHRLPASLRWPGGDAEKIKEWVPEEEWPDINVGPEPLCYADHKGKRVRLTMASRIGDVGISSKLKPDGRSYTDRASIADLSNFSDKP